MISVELNVVGGKHAGQKIPLDRKKFLIGREQDCQLRPNSELVSRHHCIFTVDEFAVRIRDLGSTNGTIVNGERIRKEVVLQQGDHVVVGSLEFNILINDGEAREGGDVTTPDAADTVVSGTDTLTEMAPIQPTGDAAAAPAQQPPAQSLTPMEMPAIPPSGTQPSGDTTVIGQPVLMPGQMPYQPMMPQHMGYPMYGGYPYPGMPMQPGQGYPGQPMMPQQQPAAPEATEKAADFPEVSLPDPATTGAKPTPPKPVATDSSGEKPPEQSNQSADAIIKNFMHRRPGR